jgi:hypothetical protein
MGRPLKMGGSAWAYLVDAVAGELGQGADAARYYASAGTPPGRFLGRGLDGLGPSPGSVKEGDVVSPEMLHRMLAQLADPVTGNPLGRPPSTGEKLPVAGFDMTFSPTKSLSLMWAIGDQATRTAVEEVLARAASEVISWAEDHVSDNRHRGLPVRATRMAPDQLLVAAESPHGTGTDSHPCRGSEDPLATTRTPWS